MTVAFYNLPADRYYSLRIAVIARLSTFVFYTRIFTVDIKIPPACRRAAVANRTMEK